MWISPPILILVMLAFFFLALGLDPTKKHGWMAAACMVVALLIYVASDDAPRFLASLRDR